MIFMMGFGINFYNAQFILDVTGAVGSIVD